jgi:hypothetical protein
MESAKHENIQVEAGETTTSIIDKIKRSDSQEITLVIPRRAVLLQSVANLKTLKKESERLKKNISVVITGEMTSTKKKVKVFDIVKRVKDQTSVREARNMEDIGGTIENKDLGISCENKFKQGLACFFQNKESKEDCTGFGKKSKKVILLPSLSSKFFAVFIFICFSTATMAMAFILPKTDINIILKAEPLAYDFELIADESISEIDSTNNKIPVRRIEISNEESESYPTTGKKHITAKASGEITVFNEYSSNPQKIVSNTRFLSKEGYLFRIKEPVIIPGFSRIEGKDVPGQVVVTVYADKPGEKYNIGPTSFTLPGLQGSRKYSSIYARSYHTMKGGVDKEVSYFSESDYITAKKELIKVVREKNKQDLSSKISDKDIPIDGVEQEEDIKVKHDVKIGDVADSFRMTVSIRTSTLLVTGADLGNLIDEKINSELAAERELIGGSRKYEVGNVSRGRNGKITIPVHASQYSVVKINVNEIKKEISGKTESELKKYFNRMKGVKTVNVSFWPFWVKSVPQSDNKVNITVDINGSI